jgi:hypothetical protein
MSPNTRRRLEAARARKRAAIAELQASRELAALEEETHDAELTLCRSKLTDEQMEAIYERAERIFDSKYVLGPKPGKPHKGGDAS